MTIDDFTKLMESRRSVRYYADKPVTKDVLEKLITVAHLAPSVENTQPWHFHVITNKAMMANLMSAACYGNFVTGAGAFIVTSCNRASKPKTQETIWNPKEMEYSCAGAIEAMMLAATTMGLGACWVSLHHGPAHDILKLKDHETIVGGLMVGYLKSGEESVHDGHLRKPIKDVVTFYE